MALKNQPLRTESAEYGFIGKIMRAGSDEIRIS